MKSKVVNANQSYSGLFCSFFTGAAVGAAVGVFKSGLSKQIATETLKTIGYPTSNEDIFTSVSELAICAAYNGLMGGIYALFLKNINKDKPTEQLTFSFIQLALHELYRTTGTALSGEQQLTEADFSNVYRYGSALLGKGLEALNSYTYGKSPT